MPVDPAVDLATDFTPFAPAAAGPVACPHCGGSGNLRLGGQRYRTCLPCLGQGQLPALESAITTARLAALRADALLDARQPDGSQLGALSAAASAAAAR